MIRYDAKFFILNLNSNISEEQVIDKVISKDKREGMCRDNVRLIEFCNNGKSAYAIFGYLNDAAKNPKKFNFNK